MTTEFGLGRRLAGTGRAAPGHLPVRRMPAHPRWRIRHARFAAGSDVVAVAAPAGAYSLVSGTTPVAAGVVVGLAATSLLVTHTWDPAALGGRAELGRLLRGMLVAGGATGLLSLALDTLAGRPWVFGVLPAAAALAVGGRVALRAQLRRLRRRGGAVTRVLAVGSSESVASLVERTRQAPGLGWSVVAACTPTGTGPDDGALAAGVPVIGDLDAVPGLATDPRFDVVAVGPAAGWSPWRLRQLAWRLAGSGTELVVDPALAENAGPRTDLATVDGLPLLCLRHPAAPPGAGAGRAVLDGTAAALLLVLVAPLLLAVAVAVRRDGGPALVRDDRLDARGRTFGRLAFRCAGDTGAALHRMGLDRLPELLHVLCGTMALVGPRPAAPGPDVHPPPVRPGLVAGYPRRASR
ncbi:hypothetical protein BJF78_19740 [Pseudonocardia sp. CNS-139]|nr:hypothetical protein BJF78_19740 [Pseudonocardia sp. CNS-139]